MFHGDLCGVGCSAEMMMRCEDDNGWCSEMVVGVVCGVFEVRCLRCKSDFVVCNASRWWWKMVTVV